MRRRDGYAMGAGWFFGEVFVVEKGDWRWIGVSGVGGGCLFWCAMGAGRSFVILAGMSMRILGAVRRIIRRGGRGGCCVVGR